MNLQEQLETFLKTFSEARIKKIVSKRGKISKHATAGRKGKKVVNGKIEVKTAGERRNTRLGQIKRKRSLKAKSGARRRRSALFAAKGRKKRKLMHVHDTRHG